MQYFGKPLAAGVRGALVEYENGGGGGGGGGRGSKYRN